jgi:hypothetical protein
MPLELQSIPKEKKGNEISTERKDELQNDWKIPELSKPISILNLVKYSKQAYYNGNPEYYDLPTSQSKSFILGYAKTQLKHPKQHHESYVDSTGQRLVLHDLYEISVLATW